MRYKIIADQGCSCCGTDDVPVAKFEANGITRLYRSIAAGLNIILKEVRKKRG